MRDLESHGDFDVALLEICDRLVKVGYPVDENGPISFKVSGQQ